MRRGHDRRQGRPLPDIATEGFQDLWDYAFAVVDIAARISAVRAPWAAKEPMVRLAAPLRVDKIKTAA
jgi:hypothetical protein